MAPFPLARKVAMSAHGQDNFDSLSDDFVNKFKPKQRDFIIEAFLQTDFRICGVQSPRPFQIECAVAPDLFNLFDGVFVSGAQCLGSCE
jgi:hypothetical protein